MRRFPHASRKAGVRDLRGALARTLGARRRRRRHSRLQGPGERSRRARDHAGRSCDRCRNARSRRRRVSATPARGLPISNTRLHRLCCPRMRPMRAAPFSKSGRHRRRRSGAFSPAICCVCISATPNQKAGSRDPFGERRHRRRLQGDHRRDRWAWRLRQAEIRIRRASRPARAGTETQGRIHTSAATVAVLPEAEEVDVDINEEDLKIDMMRAQGAGGQHVNKTESRDPHHASADRHHRLRAGRALAAQEPRSRHGAASLAHLRCRAPETRC